jgi:hypothetical protein
MRTFCCIIPARLGVLALAPITCATAAVCSLFSLYALIVFFQDLLIGQKVFLGLLGSSMGILALASIIGFFGAVAASFKAVAFYSAILSHIWLSALITGIVNFIFIMKDKDYFIKSCKDTFKDQQMGDAKAWCNQVSDKRSILRAVGLLLHLLISTEIRHGLCSDGRLLGSGRPPCPLPHLHRPPL